ncbi:MAG: MipA/OmpV family protein [Motiliproteus sp.]
MINSSRLALNSALLLSPLLVSSAAFADQSSQQSEFSLGLGATVSDSPYRDYDNDPQVIPLINYRSGNFHVRGTELGYQVYKGTGSIEVIGNLNTLEFDPDDSDSLSSLDERDMAFEAGVRYRLENLSITALTDISDTHEGERVNINYAFPLAGNDQQSGLTPAVGLDWQSDDYNNYYYGVSAAESARNGGSIGTYDADSSVNPYIKVDAYYQIAPQWTAVANVRYTWLDDNISDSSMVDDDREARASVGLNYKF